MKFRFVLFAEDDHVDALLLERAIQRNSASVHLRRVVNGDELIQYLQGGGRFGDRIAFPLPDLILLDLKMPGADGFDVLRWRLSDRRAKAVPVIVFSSSSLASDIECAYELGASSYVVKPNQPARLKDFVEALERWWCDFNAVPGRAN